MNMNRRNFLKSGSFLSLAAGLTPFSLRQINANETKSQDTPTFQKALPVWAAGREEEMNMTLLFSAEVDTQGKSVFVRMTASTIARICVNGQLAGYGPARGPHGWFRVDEWNLTPYLKSGKNRVTIEVAGYNSNSYYLMDQPSFLVAEIVTEDGEVIAATLPDGNGGFTTADLTGVRVQKVQRHSFQRPFIEVYDLRVSPASQVPLAQQPDVPLLPRRVPYPEFAMIQPAHWGNRYQMVPEGLASPWRDRAMTDIGPTLKGYKLSQLDLILSDKVLAYTSSKSNKEPLQCGSVYCRGDAQVVDFGAEYTGFFLFDLEEVEPDTELVITFDELITKDGDVDFLRLYACDATQWTLSGGNHRLESFEPHCCRYAKIHCLKGSFKLKSFAMQEYAHPAVPDATFHSSDPRLEKLFRAAVLTYRSNAVDAFTDCPHRERAGWLCDSFFTSRVAFDLTGTTDMEYAFLENFLLPERFKYIPDGMLPMCYPADHYDHVFIPSWALWFVIELGEYSRRSVDQTLVKKFEKKMEKLMNFFSQYENSDGLLEKLPSWVFVEWSAANDFVQDINYPNNMIYAAALETLGNLYHRSEWNEKAKKIREKIIEQSFDGEFFVDNAIRHEDGTLEVTRNRTEVCQYFAFYFKTVTPQSHPKLWATLLNEFGPNRLQEKKYLEIHKANAFVGNVLRLELISEAKRSAQLLNETVAYNEYMADRTGTLWENDTDYASCNHGFASHVAHVLFRDVLGIADIDLIHKSFKIIFHDLDLESASGSMPVPGGLIQLSWERKDGAFSYDYSAPDGWTVEIVE